MPTLEDLRLAQLAVAQGLTQPLEVEECLAEMRRAEDAGASVQFAEVLLGRGCVTRGQLERLLVMQREAVQKVTRIGPYDLIRKLGEGGMGAVYQARDNRNGRVVALKVLPRSKARDSVFMDRFEAEARAAFELDHPNIIKGLDLGQADGYHFLVMEYVEGQDVYSLLEKKGRLTETETLRILIQIAAALGHIHEERLVHRDIKPENILVTTQGAAKLADMGLMIDKDFQGRRRITQAGMAMGTPFYLSPEQIKGVSEADIRSDLYALGATTYEMITGRPPFEGESSAQVMMKHLQEQVPSPKDIDRNVSLNFCHVLERMMAKSPADRYQTPAELLKDLRLLQEGKPPATPRLAPARSSVARPKGTLHGAEPEAPPDSAAPVRRASAAPPAGGEGAAREWKRPGRPPSAPPGSGVRWAVLAGIIAVAVFSIIFLLLLLFGGLHG